MEEYKLGEKDLNDQSIDPVYKKGFEHGFWLKRGDYKELDDLIERSKRNENYHSGLVGGKAEAEREKIREQLKAMKTRPSKDKGHEIG